MLVCKSLISGKHIQLPEAIIGNTSWPEDQDIGKPSFSAQQEYKEIFGIYGKTLPSGSIFADFGRMASLYPDHYIKQKKESCPCKQCNQNLISPSCKEGPVSLHGKGHSDQHKNRKHGGDQMSDPFTASAKIPPAFHVQCNDRNENHQFVNSDSCHLFLA